MGVNLCRICHKRIPHGFIACSAEHARQIVAINEARKAKRKKKDDKRKKKGASASK